MPSEATPRMGRRSMACPEGSVAPTRRNAVFIPARTLGAPHTTRAGAPASRTSHTHRRSALGWGWTSFTWAMTAPASLDSGRTASTSRPAWVRRSAASSGPKEPASGGSSTISISQLNVSFMFGSSAPSRRDRLPGA